MTTRSRPCSRPPIWTLPTLAVISFLSKAYDSSPESGGGCDPEVPALL